MSSNQNVLQNLPNAVTASNAESGAKSALLSWKGLSSQWDQDTADSAGKGAVDFCAKCRSAVLPQIEKKIAECQAIYDQKEAEYEAADSLYDDACRAVRDAEDDMEKCMGYKPESRGSGMFNGVSSSTPSMNREKVIVDHYGYNQAKARAAQAKAEASRYKADADRKKKEKNKAEDALSDAENEKNVLRKKINKFIMDVYNLNLMNESIVFLSSVKSSSIELDEDSQEELFQDSFLFKINTENNLKVLKRLFHPAKKKNIKQVLLNKNKTALITVQ